MLILIFMTAFALDYNYPSSRKIDILSESLAKCMLDGLSINTSTFIPSTTYVDDFTKNICIFDQNAFFEYLMASPRRPCDYATGNEYQLRKWVLEQNDNTIDPVLIFKESMKLNKNRIFDAILTVHQLLRNEARWRSPKYYKYKSSEKAENQFWNKFMDIRGIESSDDEKVDHQGSWYRIWGIILNRFTKIKNSEINSNCISNNVVDSNVNKATGVFAELVKYLLPDSSYKAGGDRTGKSRTNVAGAQVAEVMIQIAGKNQMTASESQACADKKYLRRDYGFSTKAPVKDKSGY